MTKEEAFKNLVALNAVCGQKDFFDKEFEEALLVAEKALEQEPCKDAVNDVLETIHEEIQKEKEGITFNLNEEKARWTNGGIYDGLTWAQEIINKYKDKGVEE